MTGLTFGSQRVGTAAASGGRLTSESSLSHHPRQLPSYKNFRGVIHELGQNQYLVSGEVSVIDRNTIEITELPVRTWTQVTFRPRSRLGCLLTSW